MNIIENATQIAVSAHEGQARKTDGSPYIKHPFAVAQIVEDAGFAEHVIAAALVHDVLEDTSVREATLRAHLGDAVTDIVIAVSEDKTLAWEDRKEQYANQVVHGGEEVMAVSVADKIHNAQSIITDHATLGPAIWDKFNRGKEKKIWFERLLLSKLKEKWNHPLLEEYESLVTQLENLH
ncbi:HD domain-containing protein [Candidatus Pacebacteria bacterium]|nr:HD domain-containing protein [Candidatus Paceibacterota bacterium]